jgi:hypothetical protein
MTYNHAFTIAFSISGSKRKDGSDLTPSDFRRAIARRLGDLPDSEMMEAIGLPFDTYEEPKS